MYIDHVTMTGKRARQQRKEKKRTKKEKIDTK